MKILLLGTDKNKSGASLSMVTLAQKAKERGIEINIIIPEHGPLEETLNFYGIKYYIVNSYNWIEKPSDAKNFKKVIINFAKKIINVFADRKIMKIIDELNPDIVHINTICSGVGARSAIRKKKKLVWHIREFVEEDHGFVFWNKTKAYALISNADSLIAISKSVYNKFKKDFPVEKIKTIYNGIDIEKFYCQDRHVFENPDKVKIYMGGTIAESKGQYLLIQAADLINRFYNFNFEIHFFGSGDERYIAYLKEMVSNYHLNSIISFDGFCDKMNLEWRKADISIVASRAEAFGRVTVEAMLSGALVIGANTAGTSEIISDLKTGLLFESGNFRDLSDKIVFAINNQNKMKEIAVCGKEYAKKNFSADKNAEDILELYKTLCN